MLAPLVAERLRQLTQGAFRRGVCWDCEATLESEEGTKVDYSTATKWNHVSTCSLGKQPYRLEVNVDDLKRGRNANCRGASL